MFAYLRACFVSVIPLFLHQGLDVKFLHRLVDKEQPLDIIKVQAGWFFDKSNFFIVLVNHFEALNLRLVFENDVVEEKDEVHVVFVVVWSNGLLKKEILIKSFQ